MSTADTWPGEIFILYIMTTYKEILCPGEEQRILHRVLHWCFLQRSKYFSQNFEQFYQILQFILRVVMLLVQMVDS